jgi:drug/metabolite transporter (DMT)-like permease
MDQKRLLAAAPLLAATLWGGMFVVSKWGFATIPPLSLAFLRVAVGGAILYPLVRLQRSPRSFSRADWRRFAGLAVWLAVTLSTQFVGTDLTNASQGSLLTVLTPVFVVALGVTALEERLDRRTTAGMALATVGTLIVLADRYDLATLADGSLVGATVLVVSAFGWAGFTVFGKPVVRRYGALEAVTYATVLSLPLFGALAAVELWIGGVELSSIPTSPSVVGAVLYLGVFSTAVAWYCWYKGMEYADASAVGVFFFAQPVVGIALGALLLDEPVGSGFLVGGVLLAAGVFLVNGSAD